MQQCNIHKYVRNNRTTRLPLEHVYFHENNNLRKTNAAIKNRYKRQLDVRQTNPDDRDFCRATTKERKIRRRSLYKSKQCRWPMACIHATPSLHALPYILHHKAASAILLKMQQAEQKEKQKKLTWNVANGECDRWTYLGTNSATCPQICIFQ